MSKADPNPNRISKPLINTTSSVCVESLEPKLIQKLILIQFIRISVVKAARSVDSRNPLAKNIIVSVSF